MKNLNFFKKDIETCSRCGLCQAVCPVYLVTKNDCVLPRGKFILINEIFKRNLKPSKRLKNYMKMCINCGKCTDYCPSKIDTPKISEAFKKDYPYFKFSLSGFFVLIRYFVNFSEEKICKENGLKIFKKGVYLAFYKEREIPEVVKNSKCKVIDCGIPIEFALSNPELYKKLALNSAKKAVENNPDTILTKNALCKTEIQIGLKYLKIKRKIRYIK